MKKTVDFFPGRATVSFRKGPSGHLRQDPSDEAMRIKKKSLPSGQVPSSKTGPGENQCSHSGFSKWMRCVRPPGGNERVKLEKQQQHQKQHQKKMTRNCSACGQPKSRYVGDGSSVHFFYQSPVVKYFYCSTKVFKIYEHEGLKNPRMSFEDFAASPFFERELDAAKQRGAEWRKLAEQRAKRKSSLQLPTGRLCRFCHQSQRQGPSSPHIHTSFPGVPGKYIYCPSRVFSMYRAQGMVKMTWAEFQQSGSHDTERDRWAAEKKK